MVLISFPSWSLKSEGPNNCLSTCQSLYWYKVYNELAEKLRYLSVLAGNNNLIPCSGYFGSAETKIKNFKSDISYGGEGGWTYDPMKKGANNGVYYYKRTMKPLRSWIFSFWSPDDPIWQDRAGGKTGIYDAGIDVIIYDGGENCDHTLKSGDKGFSDRSIYYFDNNGNEKWDTNEEVWQESACNTEIISLAWKLRETVYGLCEYYYVDPDFQGGDFSGIEGGNDIPYLLKKDENEEYAQYSRIKLFPDRNGEDAYNFTQIPAYLPDGTKIMDNPVYSKNDFYNIYGKRFVFPVFFDEVRRILNRNIMRTAWIKNPSWTSNGENNGGGGSSGATLIHNNITFNIPSFEPESYPTSDTNRDDLYDTGVDLRSINNETGTIVHSPDTDEPQVILPLRWNTTYSDLLKYPEYISIGGIQDKRFTLATGDALNEIEWQKKFYLSVTSSELDDIEVPLYRSSHIYLFMDLLMDDTDNNVHIKRIGAVRPRGQVVLFDFPWDPATNKFSDIGIPLGIHSKRTYRLVRKEIYDDFFGVNYNQYSLQFDSGICHDYSFDYWGFDFAYSDGGDTFIRSAAHFTGLEFSSKASDNSWFDLYTEIDETDGATSSYYPIHGTNYDIDYEWNNEALLSKLIYKTKDGKNIVEVSLEYDADRKIKKLTKKVPINLAIDGKTEYEISVSENTITYPDGTSSVKTQTDIAGKARTAVISRNIPGTGTVETTYKYNADDLIASIRENANGSSNETTYTYCSGEERYPNTSKKCQKLKSVAYPDNSWKYYEYDENGWISKISSPFKNEPIPAGSPDPLKCRQEEYSYEMHGYVSHFNDFPYTVNWGGDYVLKEVIADSRNIREFPRTTVSYAKGLETARSHHVIDLNIDMWHEQNGVSAQKTCTKKNAAWDDQSNLTNIEYFSTYSDWVGFIVFRSESPTGTTRRYPDMTLYGELINSNFVYSGDLRTDTRNISEVFSKDSTKLSSIETITNPRGITWLRKVTDGPSSKIIESSISTTDSFGRITSTTRIDGTTETFGDYCLYGPTKYIDGNGDISIYTYNSLGRIIKEETSVSTVARTYDTIGNVTGITTAPKGKGETKSESWTYDSLSRITSHTDSVGKTTYAYSGTTTEINYPDGTVQTIQKNLDGSIASISGSAVPPTSYDYGVDSVKGRWVKEMRGATWSISYYNMLGQPHHTENSSGYWNQNTYDNAGRQNGSYDSEGRASSTVYNAKNEIAQQTVNGVTTDFANAVTQKNGKTVLQNISTVHNSTGDIVSVNESAVTGWEQWNTVNGRTTHVETTPLGAGNYTTITTDFEGRNLTEHIARNENTTDINGLTTVTSEYDGLDRTINTNDSRKPNGNTFAYRPKTDQIASVSSSDGSKSSYKYTPGKYAPSSFIPTGESKSLGLKYTDKGSLEKITGSSVFDASNIFDDLNRQTGLNTKGDAGPALTSLVYDEASSRLKEKWIAGQKCYEFEYEADGRVKTFKKTVNGSEAVKTVEYTSAPDFFYSGYSWSDGTPSVTISGHDSFGQPETISTGGVCTHEFSYNPDSQILSVKFASNLTGNKDTSYDYQNLRRSQMISGDDVVSYTYESGRLKKIISGDIEAEYSYVPRSVNLIDEITIKKGGNVVLVRDILWQDNADRIRSVTNKSGSGQIYNSFAYQYNSNGKIAKVARADNSEWRYSYDDRGQLENAARYFGNVKLMGNEFAYLSDSIGNILGGGKKKMDGSKSVQFSPNVFNNINTRVVGDKLEVSGSATPDTTVPENATVTVSVNNVKAARNGNEFSVTVDADNADFAVSKSLNVVGVFFAPEEVPEVGGNQSGNVPGTDVVATVNGNVLIPKASENPVYDLGGRLISNSLWNYSWNSEDRLISIESSTGILPVSRLKMEFAYDYAGRRIRKSVFQKSSPTDNWSLITDHFFYYDQVLLNGQPSDFGVLTAEKIVNYETNETHEFQYLWGLDVNGAYQGLGGNGGLLCVIEKGRDGSPSRPFFPLMDAKGTIYGYIDENGSQVAKFAYDPYGKITSSSIPSDYSPNAFSFTFQSKYYDSELQCYYFGFRYYDPATCRWLNRDPIEESGGLNLYAYCGNDPVNGMDYLGCVWYNPLDSDFFAYTAGYNTGLHIYETGYSPVRAGKRMWNTGASWDLVNPTGRKFFAYETLDGGLDAVRVAGGLPISYLSLDIWGRQEESSFSQGKPLIGFNGMWNTEDDIIDFRDRFRNKFGTSSRQISNPTGLKTTSFFPTALIDSFQIVGNEFGLVDITAIHGARALRDANNAGGNIINVVAHSQGTMTFYRALDLVDEPEIRSKIRYQGVGGEMFISQKYLGLESARNGWNRETGSSLSQRLLNVSSFGLFGDSLKYDLVPLTNYMPSTAKLMGAKFLLPGYGSWETPNSSENINKNGGANHGYYGNSHGIYYYDEWFNVNW